MKRRKILHIITLSELGGAQKVLYHLVAGLDPGEFEIEVACAPGGEMVRWLRQLPHVVPALEIPELKRNISPINDFKALYKLYKYIKQGHFDIVHCHSSKAGILGRLAAWLAGVGRIIFTVHGWGLNDYQSQPVQFIYTFLERLGSAVSTKVVCVSESDLAKGINLRIASPDKLTVIYNGLPDPAKQRGLLRRELNIRNEDLVIGTVARLAPQKNPLFLLQVAERIVTRQSGDSSQSRVFFVLIGDGPLKLSCVQYIKEKGLEKHVFLMGSREDAGKLIQDLDIFVLFSRWEGLPLTIIEAMQAELPVVASDVGGVGEMVVDGKTGLLVRGQVLDEAEKALLTIIDNRSQGRIMGQAGRERAMSLFSLDQMIRKYRELYLY